MSNEQLPTEDHFRDRLEKHLVNAPMEVIGITLRIHLLIEEALEQIISLRVRRPEFLINEKIEIAFFLKARIAQSVGDVATESVWSAIDRLNTLRNVLSHRLEPKRREKVISKFLDEVHELTKGRIGKLLHGDTEEDLSEKIASGGSYLLGILAVEIAEASGKRSPLPKD